MSDKFEGIDWGKDSIDLSGYVGIEEMRPVEIHHKSDGDLKSNPSFCILMRGVRSFAFGQLSLKMFNEGLAEIGYEIVKKG